MGLVDWARGKLIEYLRGAGADDLHGIDAEFDEEGGDPPFHARRFRVTVPEVAAAADAPKREKATYYVYGQTREEALRRLPTELTVGVLVEEAGAVVDGVLVFSEDERAAEVFDGRAVPGTPGPVK